MRFEFTATEIKDILDWVTTLEPLVDANPADPAINFDALYRYVVNTQDGVTQDGVYH